MQHGIEPIDLLVVNLYPFEKVVAAPDCSHDEAIENIDIGGPAMIRAAARIRTMSPWSSIRPDYAELLHDAERAAPATARLRRHLAAKAFAHTARYDGRDRELARRAHRAPSTPIRFRRSSSSASTRAPSCATAKTRTRRSAHTSSQPPAGAVCDRARARQGKDLSYNNIADADAALECVKGVRQRRRASSSSTPTRAASRVGRHGAKPTTAPTRPIRRRRSAASSPSTSALDAATAEGDPRTPVRRSRSIAPDVRRCAHSAARGKTERARARLRRAGSRRRSDAESSASAAACWCRTPTATVMTSPSLKVVTKRAPTPANCTTCCSPGTWRSSSSPNAIVYARDGRTIGIGAGQMSRVIAARRSPRMKAAEAGLEVRAAVMASDAFFPFRDGIDAAAAAGIRAVIQPGGSMRDDEVIAAADEHGMAMVFTGVRHFRH